jgi:hypothetical protein
MFVENYTQKNEIQYTDGNSVWFVAFREESVARTKTYLHYINSTN